MDPDIKISLQEPVDRELGTLVSAEIDCGGCT
jgi:hypothetical protein